jgi:phage gpG-like protein
VTQPFQPITTSQVKLAVGGLRFRGDIRLGWQVTPSIGMVARDIDRLGLDIRSFKEPLTRSVKRVIIPSIRKNFQEGGRPPWEPLSEATINIRGDAWPILIRSGKLRRGATQFNIWDIDREKAAIRSLPPGVWYGALHQEGFGGFGAFMSQARRQAGRGATSGEVLRTAFGLMDEARGGARGQRAVRIPQRQFIMFQEDDIDDIYKIFFDWLSERVHRVGGFSPVG